MESKLTFEVGKHYKTRHGKKATVYLIRPTYMVGEIEGRNDNPYTWTLAGYWSSGHGAPFSPDLVAEWREPVQMRVIMARHRVSGAVRIFCAGELPDSWAKEVYEILDTFNLVEGEGMG
jgi:hypothetical protein